MKSLSLLFSFVLTFNSITYGCSMSQFPNPPIAGISDQYYIFVGEVIGYTESVKSKNFYGEGKGYKLRLIEAINLPNLTNDYYELYKFGVQPDCLTSIKDAYLPIGTKLRIVANEAILLPNRSSENRVRLESRLFDRLTPVTEKEEFVTSHDSVFDYKSWKSLQAKVKESKVEGIRESFYDFMFMEIAKDLIRLRKAATTDEKQMILERLLYAPGIDFIGIVKPALGDLIHTSKGYERIRIVRMDSPKRIKLTSDEKKLIKSREEIEKSGYFNFQQTGFFI